MRSITDIMQKTKFYSISVFPFFLFHKFLVDIKLNLAWRRDVLVLCFETLISWLFFFFLFKLIKESTSQSNPSLLSFLLPFWHCCTSFHRYILIGSCLTLQMLQLAEYHANATASSKPPKRPSIRERKQKLLAFLRGILQASDQQFDECTYFFFIHRHWVMLIIAFSGTEKYEPVHAKWTTERCAVCRWVEDWDYNKIIICNR